MARSPRGLPERRENLAGHLREDERGRRVSLSPGPGTTLWTGSGRTPQIGHDRPGHRSSSVSEGRPRHRGGARWRRSGRVPFINRDDLVVVRSSPVSRSGRQVTTDEDPRPWTSENRRPEPARRNRNSVSFALERARRMAVGQPEMVTRWRPRSTGGRHKLLHRVNPPRRTPRPGRGRRRVWTCRISSRVCDVEDRTG